jgi:hypothetical protein
MELILNFKQKTMIPLKNSQFPGTIGEWGIAGK